MKFDDLRKISPINLIWLAAGILLAGLPHWQRLPIWIPVVHLSLLFARLYIPYHFSLFWTQRQALINLVRLFIMAGGVAGVYGSYGSLTGRDVGIALLIVLAGLKIFESKTTRDFYISAYLGYFLVITNFFYTQTIPTALYMLFVIIIMTTALVNFNDTERQFSFPASLKFSSGLILQSIPILLVLFILFPRVQGPLWGLPEDAHAGITGINDQMTPGTISKLVQSSEVAFRVTFEDTIPQQSELYWRGPVLSQTDGRKWTAEPADRTRAPSPVTFNGEVTNYELTIEPSNKRWLFGLDMIENAPEGAYITHDRQLKTRKPIHSRKVYNLTSYSNYYFDKEQDDNFERALALPKISHQQTRDFGLSLREQYNQPELIVKAALDWFKSENFVYTLKPPLITGDMVDDFLFNTRQGFCEHYAAAFTVIMRSAGIPARVVTGYQGGEVNPIGNYLIVRQHHAHAWTEVWLDEQGWIRVDPTSVISVRVSDGIEDALPDAVINIPLNLQNNTLAVNLWQRLRNTVDLVNYQWAQWVLGYGPARQQQLLQKLGFDSIDWKKMTFALFIVLGVIVAIIAIYIFTKSSKVSDPAKRYYDIFCKKMAKLGLPRKSFEGPLEFAQRTSSVRQDLQNDIQKITELYILIRYRSNHEKLQQLKAETRSFSPGKTIST